MPAYRERVYLCPEQDGQPIKMQEFPLWWDRRAFFEKFGERQIDTGNPIYVDHGLLLTAGEAMAWDRQGREQFAKDPRSQEPFMVETMRQWESLLQGIRWIIVESYEWESGLD